MGKKGLDAFGRVLICAYGLFDAVCVSPAYCSGLLVALSGTVKDHLQICRCLGGAIGVTGLHPALLSSSSDTSR